MLNILQFSSISMPPVIKTTVRNGRTLIHRVEKENIPVHIPTQVMPFTLSIPLLASDLIYRFWITPTFQCQGQIQILKGVY
jgi:hypothetical protein